MKTNGTKTPGARDARIPCDEIRDLLFDYMTRELGTAQAELVREHVRKCAGCRAAVAELQKTIDALREVSRSPEGIPAHLSDLRLQRVRRACMHPVVAWLERHHRAVSILIAVLVVAVVFAKIRERRAWNLRAPPGIPVHVITNAPAALPWTGEGP